MAVYTYNNKERYVLSNKDSLKVIALRQRIGELVSNYEEREADLRAESTIIIGDLQAKIDALEARLNAPTDVSEDDGLVQEED